jgi:hypothetical protein
MAASASEVQPSGEGIWSSMPAGAAVDEGFLMDVEEVDATQGVPGIGKTVLGDTHMVEEEDEDEEPLDTVRRNTRRRRR